MHFLRTILILGRVSNLPTVWTNAVVGWLVGGELFGASLGWILAGLSLLYWGGMTLNDAFDADWDRENAPERPIPSGAISRGATWWLGSLQLAAGTVLLLLLTDVSWKILIALPAAILAYDWLHKKWKGSVLLMGLCRALVYLAGWTAARGDMQLQATSVLIYLIAGGVLLYIAGLTLAARKERIPGNSGLGMSSRLLFLIPTAFPLLTLYCEPTLGMPRAFVYAGILLSCVWIIFCRTLIHQGKIPQGIAFSIAGIALYDATVALLLDLNGGIFCFICFGVTLLAQRRIPAT